MFASVTVVLEVSSWCLWLDTIDKIFYDSDWSVSWDDRGLYGRFISQKIYVSQADDIVF